ncbi:Gfo/Idh/MocA family protein [Microbacterium sp. G2-8]|uniref:Gfo/Idh/MocA family protein n=1 Tax=Microbacterium sp. G2-8 TaxID=2842454 RepID=UPI001C8A758E|nr:Gfo/Idh/MocA family oxidoreductase [Microbacterium sp. G2-8]
MTVAPDYRPAFPERRLNVGLVGAGAIARTAHLPAYAAWDVPVVAVASRSVESARAIANDFGIETVHASVDDLLADPRVDIVDIATGPDERVELIAAAVRAGKHVLAQKPLLVDEAEIPQMREVLADAEARGVRVAVNQNARWAPAWRLSSLLVRRGDIGDVVGVTHLHDKPLPPLVGTPFDDIAHMLLSDYLVHWIDITRCWLDGSRVSTVAAQDGRVPGQPDAARNPWQAGLQLTTDTGATAAIRIVGNARSAEAGCPFWIHGTEGTIRGSILRDTDAVELDRDGERTSFPLEGAWFVDGFAGAMGELMSAVVEGRAPENSAAHVLGSVRVGLAAVRSAEACGVPVHPVDLRLDPADAREGDAE